MWFASDATLAGVVVFCPAESRGDESAVALPASDCSLGICTLRRGRLAVAWTLLARGGGGISGIEDVDCAGRGSVADRVGCGGIVDVPADEIETLWLALLAGGGSCFAGVSR